MNNSIQSAVQKIGEGMIRQAKAHPKKMAIAMAVAVLAIATTALVFGAFHSHAFTGLLKGKSVSTYHGANGFLKKHPLAIAGSVAGLGLASVVLVYAYKRIQQARAKNPELEILMLEMFPPIGVTRDPKSFHLAHLSDNSLEEYNKLMEEIGIMPQKFSV